MTREVDTVNYYRLGSLKNLFIHLDTMQMIKDIPEEQSESPWGLHTSMCQDAKKKKKKSKASCSEKQAGNQPSKSSSPELPDFPC